MVTFPAPNCVIPITLPVGIATEAFKGTYKGIVPVEFKVTNLFTSETAKVYAPVWALIGTTKVARAVVAEVDARLAELRAEVACVKQIVAFEVEVVDAVNAVVAWDDAVVEAVKAVVAWLEAVVEAVNAVVAWLAEVVAEVAAAVA